MSTASKISRTFTLRSFITISRFFQSFPIKTLRQPGRLLLTSCITPYYYLNKQNTTFASVLYDFEDSTVVCNSEITNIGRNFLKIFKFWTESLFFFIETHLVIVFAVSTSVSQCYQCYNCADPFNSKNSTIQNCSATNINSRKLGNSELDIETRLLQDGTATGDYVCTKFIFEHEGR